MGRIPDVIETERLRLRRNTDDDAPRLLDIHSRLEVIRWLGSPPFVPMPDLDAALAMVARRQAMEESDPFACFRAIEPRDGGPMAGTVLVCPLARTDGGEVGEHEVGWHLHPDSTGLGYASEAGAAMIGAALDAGLEHLYCGMYPENEASARVAGRLGLRDLGVRPDPWYGGDSRLFETDAEHWAAGRGEGAADPVG